MRRAKAALFFILLALIPCAAALGRVWVRQDCLALGYTLSVQQQRRDALRAAVRKAELDRAQGRGPAVLREMALSQGLAPANVHQLQGQPETSPKASRAKSH